MIHIYKIPVPNLSIHFVTFRALRRRLSYVAGEKSVYPIVEATKFTAHAQYHVTCA